MTRDAPPPARDADPSPPAQSVHPPTTRRQARERLVRLCEAVLWSMARRRMH